MISLKKLGRHTARLEHRPCVVSFASVVGKREGECSLGGSFDLVSDDQHFGQDTWEKAESAMFRHCLSIACEKGSIDKSELNCIVSGDLLNQCVGSTFALKDTFVPYLGLYGACSTMAESLCIASMLIECGYGEKVCAMTGSHFCSAERQYRFPLEYGGSPTPTSQCTVTGSGAVILGTGSGQVRISEITVGAITDAGICDASNMGAAMAPAACDTLRAHFLETGRDPSYYDAVFTGDLGAVGHDILQKLMEDENLPLGKNYADCGVLIYSGSSGGSRQFGSGCGCSASVLCGHILPGLCSGKWKRVLFAATGALMSPLTAQQKESIPGICHAVAFESGV